MPPEDIRGEQLLPFADTRPRREAKIGVRQVSPQPDQIGTGIPPTIPAVNPQQALPEVNLPSPPSEPTQTLPPDSAPSLPPEPPKQPSPSDLTWGEYSKWRKSKCPPDSSRFPLEPSLDEIDQSIHEAAGEWAEVNELLSECGVHVLVNQALRHELLAELGDCVFTTAWLLDTLGAFDGSPSRKIGDHFTDLQAMEHYRARRYTLSTIQTDVLIRLALASPMEMTAIEAWNMDAMNLVLIGSRSIGRISGHFKKVRWQHMDEPAGTNELAFKALRALECLCVLCGTSTLEAALGNIEKLDARFPNGWTPGGGKR